MKLEIFPEDILLEYVQKLLDGEEKPRLKMSRYFDSFPESLEPSEEFVVSWQKMIEPVVKKFIADTFSLHQFLFDSDGYVKKFCATDAEFWQNIELSFSHRSAQRLYEHMLMANSSDEPLYLIALPADALFISIALADFEQYSYAWFAKNKASWIVSALFIAWQPVKADLPAPWQSCFKDPGSVDLPVRAYLLERASAYYSCINHLVRRSIERNKPADSDFYRLASERSGAGLPLNFVASGNIDKVCLNGRALANLIREAMNYWTQDGMIAIDDDRFLNGIFNESGLARELIEFETVIKEFSENKSLEERVDESIIFN